MSSSHRLDQQTQRDHARWATELLGDRWGKLTTVFTKPSLIGLPRFLGGAPAFWLATSDNFFRWWSCWCMHPFQSQCFLTGLPAVYPGHYTYSGHVAGWPWCWPGEVPWTPPLLTWWVYYSYRLGAVDDALSVENNWSVSLSRHCPSHLCTIATPSTYTR